MRTFLLLAATVLLLAGCVSARATMLVPGAGMAPVPPDQVTIYLSAAEVPEHCERIALITTSGSATGTSTAATYEAARRRAGKIGANAILVDEIREPSTGRQVANAVLGVNADRKGEMLAYRCPTP